MYVILDITIVLSILVYPISVQDIIAKTRFTKNRYQTILAKSPGTLSLFLLRTSFSSPSSPKQCCFSGTIRVITKDFRVLPNYIYISNQTTLFWGQGGAARRNAEHVFQGSRYFNNFELVSQVLLASIVALQLTL